MAYYTCFTDQQKHKSIDLAKMGSRDIPCSAVEKGIKSQISSASSELIQGPRQRHMSVNSKFIAIALQNKEIEVRERFNKDNQYRFRIQWDVQDLFITEDNILFLVTQHQLLLFTIENTPKEESKCLKVMSDDDRPIEQQSVISVSPCGSIFLEEDIRPVNHQKQKDTNMRIQVQEYLKDSREVLSVAVYTSESFVYLKLQLEGSQYREHYRRVWDLRMLYGKQGPWPCIVQVAVAESELLHILDSLGRITIINKDLQNDDHGIIFVHKSQLGPISQFFLLSELNGFMPREPKDNIQTFKRDKKIDPYGIMITVHKRQENKVDQNLNSSVNVWNLESELNKKEGSCELTSSIGFESKIIDCHQQNDLLLLIHEGSFRFTILQVSPTSVDDLYMRSCTITQLNQYTSSSIKQLPSSNELNFQVKECTSGINNRQVELFLMTHNQSDSTLRRFLIKFTQQKELFQLLLQKQTEASLQKMNFNKGRLEQIKPEIEKMKHALKVALKSATNFGQICGKSIKRAFQSYVSLCKEVQEKRKLKLVQCAYHIPDTQQVPSLEHVLPFNSSKIGPDSLPDIEEQKVEESKAPSQTFLQNLNILSSAAIQEAEQPSQKPLTEKQLRKLTMLSQKQSHFSTKLSESLEQCSVQVKKRVQYVKQIQPAVKPKITVVSKATAPRIIEDTAQKVCQSIHKSQQYYTNAQSQEVNQMCSRVFVQQLKSQKVDEQEKQDIQKAQIEFEKHKVEKQKVAGDSLRATCRQLFNEQFKDMLKATVAAVGKELIVSPYQQFGSNINVQHQQLLNNYHSQIKEQINQVTNS